MKKFVLATIAASLLAGPVLAAPAQAQGYGQRTERTRTVTRVRETPRGTVVTQRQVTLRPTYRNWRRGERFDRRYAANYQVLDYRQHRGWRVPPRGYHYVRSGNDALLVAISTGVIASILVGAAR